MAIEIGHIESIHRYPVKSMRGEALGVASLGWHGIDGDRRLALRRLEARGGNPWLTAGRLAELLRFTPIRLEESPDELPTHVRTPEGEELELFGEELAGEISRRQGEPVQMMQLRHGIFDEAAVSVITSATVREIGRLAGCEPDARRFRPNLVVRTGRGVPFEEDEWLGGTLVFGDGDDAARVAVTTRDVRCSMVALDPDDGSRAPEVLRACVSANENNAGVYGTITGIGRIEVGQAVTLLR